MPAASSLLPLLLLLSTLSSLSSAYNFSVPQAIELDGYGTYKKACVKYGIIEWEEKSRPGAIDWDKPVTIVVEALPEWFVARNNFYHISTVFLPAASFAWRFPNKVAAVALSASRGKWIKMSFTNYWVKAAKGPQGKTRVILADPAKLVCFENAIYIHERSYLGRAIQPYVRKMLLDSCGAKPPKKAKKKTALLYRRLGSADMAHPGSATREFTNTTELLDVLHKRGYTVRVTTIPPEFCDQVKELTAGHEIIISPHGAQNLMMMVSAHGTKVVEFFPDRFKSLLYCSIKYAHDIRWFNVLRAAGHVVVTEECSHKEDTNSLPGCVFGYREGFCCRRCSWRRDKPIYIRGPEHVLDYVSGPPGRPPLSFWGTTGPHMLPMLEDTEN